MYHSADQGTPGLVGKENQFPSLRDTPRSKMDLRLALNPPSETDSPIRQRTSSVDEMTASESGGEGHANRGENTSSDSDSPQVNGRFTHQTPPSHSKSHARSSSRKSGKKASSAVSSSKKTKSKKKNKKSKKSSKKRSSPTRGNRRSDDEALERSRHADIMALDSDEELDDDDMPPEGIARPDQPDHNRWWCNKCKDIGELVCCDRCPRAYHLSCLGISADDLPEDDWYCPQCVVILERRKRRQSETDLRKKMRLEMLEQKRVEKEKQRKEREEQARKKQEEREQLRKTKEMERETVRKKKAEEKLQKEAFQIRKEAEKKVLGKMRQKVVTLREGLEAIEKEERELARKEEASRRKRYPIEDSMLFDEPEAPTSLGARPAFSSSVLEGIDDNLAGDVLMTWDFVTMFTKTIDISPFTLNELRLALLQPEANVLLCELHMKMIQFLLDDRDDDVPYSDEDDDGMGVEERSRFASKASPLTLGVPKILDLTPLTWPQVLSGLVRSIPRYLKNGKPVLKQATSALDEIEYPQLDLAHKVALLRFLVDAAYDTDEIRILLRSNMDSRIEKMKDRAKIEAEERRVRSEEEKKLKEAKKLEKEKLKAKEEKAKEEPVEEAPQEEEDSEIVSSSETESEEDPDIDESIMSRAELLKYRQEKQRHKQIKEERRENKKLRRAEIERAKKAKQSLERKKENTLAEIKQAMEDKDVALLKSALEKGKELGFDSQGNKHKEYFDALEALPRLERDAEDEEKKRKRDEAFEKEMSMYFIRTQMLGSDRYDTHYWVFGADSSRLYAESIKRRDDLPKLENSPQPLRDTTNVTVEQFAEAATAQINATQPDTLASVWSYLGTKEDVEELISSLDERGIRGKNLKRALQTQLPTLTKLGKRKRELGQENEEKDKNTEEADSKDAKKVRRSTSPELGEQPTDSSNAVLTYYNKCKNKVIKKDTKIDLQTEAVKAEFARAEGTIASVLPKSELEAWKSVQTTFFNSIKAAQAPKDCVEPLLQLEAFLFSVDARDREIATSPPKEEQSPLKIKVDHDEVKSSSNSPKSEEMETEPMAEEEEEDEEEDEVPDEDRLWPTKKARKSWIDATRAAQTVAALILAMSTLVQRSSISIGRDEIPKSLKEDGSSARPKRVPRATYKDASDSGDETASEQEWQDKCYICETVGELMQCDKCGKSFHPKCAGYRSSRSRSLCTGCKDGATGNGTSNSALNTPASDRKKRSRQSSTGGNGDIVSPPPPPPQLQKEGKGKGDEDDTWDTDCHVCGKRGNLICCEGCPHSFHPACLNLKKIPQGDWFCDECATQTCGSCGKGQLRLDSHVICGNEEGTKGCEKVFHLSCVGLKKLPEDDWYCDACKSTTVSS